MEFRPYDLLEFIELGGFLMWPILACSVIAFAITLERLWRYRRAQTGTREFMDALRPVLRQDRVQEAILLCDESDAPMARVAKAGLLKYERGKTAVREALEDAGRLEVPRLERYLGALATCTSVAPLLGLLGTVVGMVRCMVVITDKGGLVNPADLAGGIGNALVTTAAGLTVGIPALIAYNYLVSRVENLTLEMEVNSSELLDLLARDDDR